MPLNTQVIRNGEPLKISWGEFHVAAMLAAVMFEDEDGKFAAARPNDNLNYPADPQPLSPKDTFQLVMYPVVGAVMPTGEVTLTRDHAFEDVMDGEVFELWAGDVLCAWRDS